MCLSRLSQETKKVRQVPVNKTGASKRQQHHTPNNAGWLYFNRHNTEHLVNAGEEMPVLTM